jgi:hypothetical protein
MGVGTIITKSLIDLVRATSCDTIFLIATALGEPVYKRLGFTVHAEYMFLDDGKLPAAADAMGIVPFDPQYLDAFLRLDRRASGEDRRRLFQPHLRNTKLALDGNEVKAFLIPTLGEGLIVSVDPSVGTELMKHKSAINSMFCIPLENVHGVNFLKEHGFKEVKKASRMIFGKKIQWDGSTIFGRIGGNLG